MIRNYFNRGPDPAARANDPKLMAQVRVRRDMVALGKAEVL